MLNKSNIANWKQKKRTVYCSLTKRNILWSIQKT